MTLVLGEISDEQRPIMAAMDEASSAFLKAPIVYFLSSPHKEKEIILRGETISFNKRLPYLKFFFYFFVVRFWVG